MWKDSSAVFRDNMALLTRGFQMSGFQNCETIPGALSHPVCGTLLWQPQKTNTPLKTLPLQQHLFEKLPHYPTPYIP